MPAVPHRGMKMPRNEPPPPRGTAATAVLIRHTLLYLPAQLIGPVAQFAAAVVWTHWMSPDVYGVLTFMFAAQELAFVMSLSWWSQYTLRYFGALRSEQTKPYRETEGPVLAATAFVQAALASAALGLIGVRASA